jgi:hypothetical protein
MSLIRMRDSVAGRNFSHEYGEVVNTDSEQAQAWVSAGIAEYVTAEPVLTPERRMQATEVRRRPGRPRKNPV